jgi:hypothetical protein
MKATALTLALTGMFLMTLAAGASAWPASGTIINYDIGYVETTADGFKYPMTDLVDSGSASPNSSTMPWLMAEFSGGITTPTGTVTLTLSAPNLSVSPTDTTKRESVAKWLFNLDPSMDPTKLSFGAPVVTAGAMTAPQISLGADQFQARTSHSGLFDILLQFSSSGGAQGRFDAGDSVQFTITGIDSLNAASFLQGSAIATDQYTFNTQAFLQDVGANYTEDTYVAPEPATLAMLGLGGLAVFARYARKSRKA